MNSTTALLSQSRPAIEERNFYLSMGIVCTLIVFVGFSPSYFLRTVMEPPRSAPPISIYIHLHAAVFISWLALFITQTALVKADRRDLHRRLGILGLVIAIALLTLNMVTVLNAIGSGRTAIPPIPRLFLAFSSSAVAAGFILTGLYFRRSRDVHKRFMLLATIGMIGPAINRITANFEMLNALGIHRRWFSVGTALLLIGAGMLNDYMRRRRVHPAYIVGVCTLVGLQLLLVVVPQSQVWRRVATWLLTRMA
jgi:uncharacterized membrane protein